jgi:hypothetical protein
MILEEINGAVTVTVIRETGTTDQLAVGDYFSDHERSSLSVVGTGNIVVRVDANSTLEFRAVEPAEPVIVKDTVEEVVAPVVQQMAVEDTVAVVTETPVIIFPVKTAE